MIRVLADLPAEKQWGDLGRFIHNQNDAWPTALKARLCDSCAFRMLAPWKHPTRAANAQSVYPVSNREDSGANGG